MHFGYSEYAWEQVSFHNMLNRVFIIALYADYCTSMGVSPTEKPCLNPQNPVNKSEDGLVNVTHRLYSKS